LRGGGILPPPPPPNTKIPHFFGPEKKIAAALKIKKSLSMPAAARIPRAPQKKWGAPRNP